MCVLCPLYLSLPKHNAIRVGREPMKEYETNIIIKNDDFKAFNIKMACVLSVLALGKNWGKCFLTSKIHVHVAYKASMMVHYVLNNCG